MNHRRFVRLGLISLASASLAMGQAATSAVKQTGSSPAASSSPAQAESNVSPETPVITLNDVCDVTLNGTARTPSNGAAKTLSNPTAKTPPTAAGAKTGTAAHTAAASAAPCKTEVTRAEFDQLMKLVAPNAPASARRQIATKYVQLLTAANEAIKIGVEKEPTFPIMRLQFLAQAAESKLRADAAKVSDADAQTYYDQNQAAFEEVTLTRIFIPRSPPAPAAATQTSAGTQPAAGAQPVVAQPAAGAQAQSSAADAEAIAKATRDQLAAGGDPEKLQKSAYDQLKNTTPPPNTKLGAKRRATLPPNQEAKVFALKAGDVSEVFSDTVGYTIYRVDSRQLLPFDQAKDQAKQAITHQRLADVQQQMQKMINAGNAKYNDTYFGPETAAAAAQSVPQQTAPPAATPVPAPNAPQYPVNSQTPTPVTNQPQRSQPTTPKD